MHRTFLQMFPFLPLSSLLHWGPNLGWIAVQTCQQTDSTSQPRVLVSILSFLIQHSNSSPALEIAVNGKSLAEWDITGLCGLTLSALRVRRIRVVKRKASTALEIAVNCILSRQTVWLLLFQPCSYSQKSNNRSYPLDGARDCSEY